MQFLLNAGFVALGLYVASKVLNVDLGSKVADSLDANTPPSPPGGKYAQMTPGPTNVSQKDDPDHATQSFDWPTYGAEAITTGEHKPFRKLC